tara:strand:- start:363 stop:590 length:228 start_codon:yes stop_codon:yes gene_type:complete
MNDFYNWLRRKPQTSDVVIAIGTYENFIAHNPETEYFHPQQFFRHFNQTSDFQRGNNHWLGKKLQEYLREQGISV